MDRVFDVPLTMATGSSMTSPLVTTSGIFGDYQLVNGGERIFGLANETLAEDGRRLYLAFDDAYVLHIKRNLVLPETPHPEAPVRVADS